MKNLFVASLLALSLFGCTPTGAIRPGETFTTRELTPAEKLSLSKNISQSLKDAESARFKWMPVVLREREGATHYCGLVNAKNSYGGYTGFMRFWAALYKDDVEGLTKNKILAIEKESDHVPNIFFVTRWLNGVCEDYGYVDFSLAT